MENIFPHCGKTLEPRVPTPWRDKRHGGAEHPVNPVKKFQGSGEEIPEKEIGEEDGEEGPGHPARSGEGRAQAEQRQHREREEEKGIQGEGGAELAVQEQMGRPQGSAGGASEAGEGAEGAGGVDGGRGRIDEIQHGGGTESGKGEEKMKRKPQFPISTAQYPIAKGQPAGAAGGVLPRRARTVLRSAQVSTFLRGSRRR